MKQVLGISKNGDLKEAVKEIENPCALIFMTTEEKLEEHAKQLEEIFPGIPSIGGVGKSYGNQQTNENGVTVVALHEHITAAANVIEELSTMPVKYIKRLEEDIKTVNAQSENTVCFDFCTGNDSCLVTTLNSVLKKKKLSLVGATSSSNKIAVNGKTYENACAYLLIKNENGRIKVYKENIYKVMEQYRMTVTKTNTKEKQIFEIDGKPAEQVYRESLHITKDEVITQTFKNPLGRCYGSEVYIISIKEIKGSGLECYKQVNNMDVLTIMELDDYRQVIKNTLSKMQKDLKHVSAILSVNCILRYLFFEQEQYWDEYLKEMCSFSEHAGLIGLGEHYNTQHVNQTMCCVAFE